MVFCQKGMSAAFQSAIFNLKSAIPTMSFFSALRVAFEALLVHKGRSTLTSLGIVIGVGAVIAMVSAGDSARQKLDERLNNVGKNLILIRAGTHTQTGSLADVKPLHSEDADVVRKQLGPLVLGVCEVQVTMRNAATRTQNWKTMIVGTSPDMEAVRMWEMEHGRFFTGEDVKKQAPVCVLGKTVRDKLFPDAGNPVGKMIRVDRMNLRVVGVVRPKGRMPTGGDQDDQIFVPLPTLQRKIVGEDQISIILTAVRNQNDLAVAKDQINKVLRDKHHVKEGHEDFDVSSVQEMAELAVILTNTMHILVALIASISLIVGGIGIMNIMLVSVTERTREIGIRAAVGASSYDVLVQFLIEAVVLSLLGGLLGILLGIAGAAVVAWLIGWPVYVNPHIVLLAFAVSAGVGVFFGYYPALKASRLDPIEALRHE
jgi:putative ABC transport system permease protein